MLVAVLTLSTLFATSIYTTGHHKIIVVMITACLKGTASEATLVALLTARKIMLARHKKADPNLTETSLIPKLVCYMSDQVWILYIIKVLYRILLFLKAPVAITD